jgi:toxin YoeB
MWYVEFTRQAAKDAKRLKAAGLDAKAKALVEAVRADPFGTPPSYEALVGSLSGLYSRRINLQRRFVYSVSREPVEKDGLLFDGVVRVVRMWTRYEGIR